MKWLRRILISLMIIAALLGGWWWRRLQTYRHFSVPQHDVATVFVPGYGGNWISFGPMIGRMNRYHVGTAAETLQVHANSVSVKHEGRSGKNPLINVLFDNPFKPATQAKQMRLVMAKLKQMGITKVNLVGHSSGANIIYDYLTRYRHESDPIALKFVSFATDYTTSEVNEAERLPHALQVQNIGGQIWRSDGDWAINGTSREAFTAAVAPYVASVQTVTVHGSPLDSYHSMLHQNPDVDKLIAQFLFTNTNQNGVKQWYNKY